MCEVQYFINGWKWQPCSFLSNIPAGAFIYQEPDQQKDWMETTTAKYCRSEITSRKVQACTVLYTLHIRNGDQRRTCANKSCYWTYWSLHSNEIKRRAVKQHISPAIDKKLVKLQYCRLCSELTWHWLDWFNLAMIIVCTNWVIGLVDDFHAVL